MSKEVRGCYGIVQSGTKNLALRGYYNTADPKQDASNRTNHETTDHKTAIQRRNPNNNDRRSTSAENLDRVSKGD